LKFRQHLRLSLVVSGKPGMIASRGEELKKKPFDHTLDGLDFACGLHPPNIRRFSVTRKVIISGNAMSKSANQRLDQRQQGSGE